MPYDFRIMIVRLLCIFLLGIAALVSSSNHNIRCEKRWRSNNYIRDDGILPYQMCSASKAYGRVSSMVVSTTVDLTVDGKGATSFDVLLLASSVWGNSSDCGEPTSVKAVENMVFLKKHLAPFNERIYGHTIIPTPHADAAVRQAKAHCKFVFNSNPNNNRSSHPLHHHHHHSGIFFESTGYFDYTKPTKLYDKVGPPYNPVVMSLFCPLPLEMDSREMLLFRSTDSLELHITLSSSESSSNSTVMVVDLCYEHVAREEDLVMITEPLYRYCISTKTRRIKTFLKYNNKNSLLINI